MSHFYYQHQGSLFSFGPMKRNLFVGLMLLHVAHSQAQSNRTETQEAIIRTLELETRYFCERQLENWQAQWSHRGFVSKMYAGNGEFQLFDGWAAIHSFTQKHIQESPEPIPLPDSNFDYEFHVFTETAWVFYSKNVDGNPVRETRFMVKEDEKWKIARMETVY